MMSDVSAPPPVRLLCHPATPCSAVSSLEVAPRFTAEGSLVLAYRLDGALAAIRLPDPQPAGEADGLWRHTCFEAFVAPENQAGYREFNFSPSGQWANYAFRRWRERIDDFHAAAAPAMCLEARADHLLLVVSLPADCLPTAGALQVGLSAVIETTDGMLSYWALRHPGTTPDFHHRDGFTLHLGGSRDEIA